MEIRALTSEALLDAWERGRALSEPDRCLALCAAGCPERSHEELEAEPIGRRDRLLRAIRRATYGRLAPCFVACPECGEELELELDLDAFDAEIESLEGPFTLDAEGARLRFRLPSSADLRAASRAATTEGAREALLSRCVIEASVASDAIDPATLPPAIVGALSSEMERLDPDADVRLSVACPACAARWSSPFDIASFLWREVDVDAKRLLREVDAIARGYGWSESEILRLGPARRRAYLELLGWA